MLTFVLFSKRFSLAMRQNRDDHEKTRPLVGVYSFTLTILAVQPAHSRRRQLKSQKKSALIQVLS